MYGKQQIELFEDFIGLGPTKAARFLGRKYTTYVEYKNSLREEEKQREAPEHFLYSVEAHSLLSREQLEELKKKRLHVEIDDLEFSPEVITAFENRIGLGATYTSEFLGRKYNTYSEYKNERQEIPAAFAYSIEAHTMLKRSQLRSLISQRLGYDKLVKMTKMKIKSLEKMVKRVPKAHFPLLLGCSFADYTLCKNGEQVMPDRWSDCIAGLVQMSEAGLLSDHDVKNIIRDRLEGGVETMPSAEAVVDFMGRYSLSNAQMAELMSCSEAEIAEYIERGSLPDDVASLLYVLMLMPKNAVSGILKTL